MSGIHEKNITWLTEFHHKTPILDEVCERITYRDGQGKLWVANTEPATPNNKVAYSLEKFPSYLQPVFREKKAYRTLEFPSVKGFAIDMASFSNLEDYMRAQFDKKVRGHQTRAMRRLEHSYDLREARYYGNIDKDECDSLLNQLKSMIVHRFKQRQQQSDTLKVWDTIEKTTYNHILDKKASLLVLYHGNQPLSISISYHYDQLFFYYITSYDTNFAKFSIGNIMIMKQLDWCFKNGYQYFDMGWGDLDYKRRWCNLVYQYHRYILIPRNSITILFKALTQGYRTTIMAYLLNRGYNKKYHRFKARLQGKKQAEVPFFKGKAGSLRKINSTDAAEGTKVDPAMFPVLSYHINNFLYASQEKFEDIKLYQLASSKFIIRAKYHEQSIENLQSLE